MQQHIVHHCTIGCRRYGLSHNNFLPTRILSFPFKTAREYLHAPTLFSSRYCSILFRAPNNAHQQPRYSATKTTKPLSFSDIMKQHWEECCIPCSPTTNILCYKNNRTPIVFWYYEATLGGVLYTILTNNQDTLLQNQAKPYRFLTILAVTRRPWSHPEQKYEIWGYRSSRTPIVFCGFWLVSQAKQM